MHRVEKAKPFLKVSRLFAVCLLSFFCLCVCLCLSVCLSFYSFLSVCLFVSVCLPVFLQFTVCVFLCVCLSAYLLQFPVHMCVSLCLSVCLYFFLFSVCLSVYVCLSACLVVSLLTILHIHTSVWEPICLSACLPVYFVHPFQAILEEDENSHFLLFLWLNDCCIMQIQSATMLTPLSKQKCNELAEFFLANKWEC